MVENKLLLSVLCRELVVGLNAVSCNGGARAFVMCLRNASVDKIKEQCAAAGLSISANKLREAIGDFQERYSRLMTSHTSPAGKNWRADQIFPGEILSFTLMGRQQLGLLKADYGGRFWVAESDGDLAKMSGAFISLPPDALIGANRELDIKGFVVNVSKFEFAVPNIPMSLLNECLTPRMYQYGCCENLEDCLIAPLFEALSGAGDNYCMPIAEWDKWCAAAVRSGQSAFTLWYIMSRLLNVGGNMYK